MSNDTETLTLADFLLARIAEDEVAARLHRIAIPRLGMLPEHYPYIDGDLSARLLAECAAKRRIVEGCENQMTMLARRTGSTHWVLRALAQPCSDHPDFRDEWRA